MREFAVIIVSLWALCGLGAWLVYRDEWFLRLGARMPLGASLVTAVESLYFGLLALIDSVESYTETRLALRYGRRFAALLLLGLASPAFAGHCVYHAPSYSYNNYGYQYEYHNAGWYNGKWYPAGNYYYANGGWYLQGYGYMAGYASPAYYYPTYEKVKVVYREVEPDYYASVRDFYRDSLFADAVAYRILTAQAKGASAPSPPQPLPDYGGDRPPPRRAAAAPSINTPVSPKLQAFVTASCIKCHNGPGGKGGLDLSNLAACSPLVRWKCYASVNDGSMPQGGPEAKPDDVKEIIQWRDNGDQAARPGATSQSKIDTTQPKETDRDQEVATTDRRRTVPRP